MSVYIDKIAELVREFYAEQARTARSDGRIRLSAPAFDDREAMNAIRTILGGWISQGPNVQEFERRFAGYVGVAHGVAVNSGSSANLIALHALRRRLGLEDGDEVIVPATTFATVAMPVLQVGLTPVYVDVDRHTLNIAPEAVDAAVTARTRVIMPVHTLGFPAEMNALAAIAARRRLTIFEDCCEAHGSALNGRKVGSFGLLSSFSFFVAHNMTTGEGGMVVTDDADLAEECRSLREFGRLDPVRHAGRYYSDDRLHDYDRRYVFSRVGYNLRMTDVAAAFGLEQLAKLDAMNERRRANAALLRELLIRDAAGVLAVPQIADGAHHTYYTFPMVLAADLPFSRREFCEHLESEGIETRPLFGGCLPDQPAFRGVPGRIDGDLVEARFLRDHALFVGIHPALGEGDMRRIATVIQGFVHERGVGRR